MPPAFIEHSLGAKRVYNIIMAYQVGPTYHSPVANGRTDTLFCPGCNLLGQSSHYTGGVTTFKNHKVTHVKFKKF